MKKEHDRQVKEFEQCLKEAEKAADEHRIRAEEAKKAAELRKRDLLEAMMQAERHQKYGEDTYKRLVEVKEAAANAKRQVMEIDGHLNPGRFKLPRLTAARAAVRKAHGILENIV
ncbi:hypothetical protein HZC09_06375 [Candidatus Micrarchaeota archaeon]|nr:hypothetical protein [Candidatus Micrarchaeota archaeon]